MSPPNRSRPAANGAASPQTGRRLDFLHGISPARQPLTSDIRQLIAEGGEDGSRVAWRIGLAMFNAGWSFADYRAVMTDPLNGCSKSYRDRRDGRPAYNGKHRKSGGGEARALRGLERCWVKYTRPRRPDASDVLERTEALKSKAATELAGRSRATTLKVLDAVCTIAIRHATARPLLAVRDVALLAGVSLQTAHKALNRLVDGGLLKVRGRTSQGARIFELPRRKSEQTCLSIRREESVHLRDTSADVWRHTDLGASGLLIYSALTEDTVTVSALANITGLHRSTVSRRLRDLAERDLAEQVEPHEWRLGPADPTTSSRWPSEDSPAERDANRYEDERAQRRRGAFTVVGTLGKRERHSDIPRAVAS